MTDLEKRIYELYDRVFNGSDAYAAAEYMDPGYKQHNPGVADSLQGFMDTFARDFAKGKKMSLKVAKIVAGEGMAAVYISRLLPDGSYNPYGDLVDLYRVGEDGKFIEHWDIFNRRGA